MISPQDLDLLTVHGRPGRGRRDRRVRRRAPGTATEDDVKDWIDTHAAAIAARAPRELEALVAVSSPSGDVRGAEEAAAVAAALAPEDAEVERLPCSSPDHAPDLLMRGRAAPARKRILLLGHLDTVIAHADHRPLRREDDRLVGSGTVDMKGGDVLALGVLRALADAARGLRRGRAAARVRRGVARRAVPARRAVRGLRRLPVLRGRPARRRTGASRSSSSARRAGTVQVKATGRSAHSRLGPAPRHQRAARPRGRGPGPRRPPRPGRPAST